MDQYEIAEVLREIAVLIELQDPVPLKAIAYRRAAKTLTLIDNFEKIVKKGELTTLPGIGKEIASMILELMKSGKLAYHMKLKQGVPETIFDLVSLPRFGPKKTRIVFQKLGITSLDELEKACLEGKLSKLGGFGPKTVERLLKNINLLRKHKKGVLFSAGLKIATSIMNTLAKSSKKIEVTGELRRKCEVIKEIDIVALFSKSAMDIISKHTFIKEVVSQTKTSFRALLKQGVYFNLTLTSEDAFQREILFTTGSRAHQGELKKRELELNLTLAELSFEKEEGFYKALKIDYIPPELREGQGEVRAAKEHRLPKLVESDDLRGMFHCHTEWSDGSQTLEEVRKAAENLEWEYIGISDHSKSSYQAGGLDEERLFEQIEQIKLLNKTKSSVYVFSGLECDILKEGELDFPNDVLKHLDFVIISIHRYFQMEKEIMTKRIIKAIENPYTTILGHLTGRILLYRDPYEVDVDKIVDASIANGKIIELNAYPSRLDMDWRYWKKAKEKGLKCSINCDSHGLGDFRNYKIGVNCARKGWLEKKDVINTLSLREMKKKLISRDFS